MCSLADFFRLDQWGKARSLPLKGAPESYLAEVTDERAIMLVLISGRFLQASLMG